MNDFEYDCKCKKDIARSAHNHVNARRGKCKLPHEYLTKKEREAMNGEVKAYQLNEPMRWAEFKTMPTDIQMLYIKSLQEKYHANDLMLANLFNCHWQTIAHKRRALKIESVGSGTASQPTAEQIKAWNIWRAGAVAETPVETPVEEHVETPVEEHVKEPKVAPATETKPDGKAATVEMKPPVADIQGFRVIWENVRSWEELYALVKQFPFPGRPAKIRLDLV